MLRRIARLKAKKGFTLVEMVVVIGIVAIMVSVAVPSMINSQLRAEGRKHNEVAGNFYASLQLTLLATMEFDNSAYEFQWNGVNRVSGAGSLAGGSDSFFLYVSRGDDGVNATLTYGGSAPVAVGQGNYPNIGDTPNDVFFARLMRELNGYSRSDPSGHYYAMFDSNFRVTMTYYSEFTPLGGFAGATITRDNMAAGRMFGSFPIQYSFVGSFSCTTALRDKCDIHVRSKGESMFMDLGCPALR